MTQEQVNAYVLDAYHGVSSGSVKDLRECGGTSEQLYAALAIVRALPDYQRGAPKCTRNPFSGDVVDPTHRHVTRSDALATAITLAIGDLEADRRARLSGHGS